LPGLGRSIVRFARRLELRGFQVHLPHLFGEIGKRQACKNYRALCTSLEFGKLAAGVSAPITRWLRALANDISEQNSGARVGAIGMCVTGAFRNLSRPRASCCGPGDFPAGNSVVFAVSLHRTWWNELGAPAKHLG
jgi:dienelactone hydrolase